MNPKIQTIDYYAYNNSLNTIVVIADMNAKAMVLQEHNNKVSLTNSIEPAIEEAFKFVFGYKRGNTSMIEDWIVLQDCGDEGYFRVKFDIVNRTGMTTNGGGLFEKQQIANPSWSYFSKDLKAFSVLYGANK